MSDASASQPGGRATRLAIVLIGIVLGQAALYGPSLIGKKILLPLDCLAERNVYLPNTPEYAGIRVHDRILSDLVLQFEPERTFAVREFRAGRVPMWMPDHFAGAPFVWPKFSPLLLPQGLVASPRVLAWGQLLCALVAGLGMYGFCRGALALGFWPAAVAAWCYPLTGFFVLWQGYPVITSVYWLPWMFLATDAAVRRPGTLALGALAGMTALVLVSGHLDMAGQVLMVSGLFALWRLWEFHRETWAGPAARKVVLGLVAGWALGFLLAAPQLLPFLEYSQTGARMARRSAGAEERPPVGLAALPQVVLPDLYGSTARGSFPRFPKGQPNLLESSAAAHVGVLATLCLAPLAWCSRRHRALSGFLAFLALFALSWCLDLPGFVDLLRMPGLNLMSHNRLVFATGFALLVLAAIGLDALLRERPRWQPWMWLPAGTLAILSAWCLYGSIALPEPIATQLDTVIQRAQAAGLPQDFGSVQHIQRTFARQSFANAVLCAFGVGFWLWLWRRTTWPRLVLPVMTTLLLGNLLWHGYGQRTQSDPALYYPPLPVLQEVARAEPGRILGYQCLPAALPVVLGLRDIRGYDAVDPARLMDLMLRTAMPGYVPLPYAQTQRFAPNVALPTGGPIRLPPILDMLGVRYVIFRGQPPPKTSPDFQQDDYWVMVNHSALPRAYVPRRVEVVEDDDARVEKLAAAEFDPREVAYVETPLAFAADGRGTAEIVSENPTRLTVAARMETPGLLVLADLWDKGWRAYLDGQLAPILRVNHALRGVALPAGNVSVEFRYQPASLALGLWLAAGAAGILLLALAAGWRRSLAAATRD